MEEGSPDVRRVLSMEPPSRPTRAMSSGISDVQPSDDGMFLESGDKEDFSVEDDVSDNESLFVPQTNDDVSGNETESMPATPDPIPAEINNNEDGLLHLVYVSARAQDM
ncbi:unnamed protein product [Phytophthora fragariaefolia]|uniref:Unnamed protein product n=1 Tax=Phytophthora fragariaefolia TaxID=1490495 RepID=A0A9W7CUN0_9STRA|nr:unnamed protein product [Phytophthora fragariaefolia]